MAKFLLASGNCALNDIFPVFQGKSYFFFLFQKDRFGIINKSITLLFAFVGKNKIYSAKMLPLAGIEPRTSCVRLSCLPN